MGWAVAGDDCPPPHSASRSTFKHFDTDSVVNIPVGFVDLGEFY